MLKCKRHALDVHVCWVVFAFALNGLGFFFSFECKPCLRVPTGPYGFAYGPPAVRPVPTVHRCFKDQQVEKLGVQSVLHVWVCVAPVVDEGGMALNRISSSGAGGRPVASVCVNRISTSGACGRPVIGVRKRN